MNIIAAWKSAKEGQRITRKAFCDYRMFQFKKRDDSPLNTAFMMLEFADLIADDWEVVKEKKKDVWELNAMLTVHPGAINAMFPWHKYPDNAKVTIEWEE